MKIKAIIVTYNGIKWIDKCLGSLVNSIIPLDIFVIDNGSTDGTIEKLENDFPEVKIAKNTKNLGFGMANNIGLKQALHDGSDYVFLLNQDAWIQPETIQQLVSIAEKYIEFGIISPIHLNGAGNKLDRNFKLFLAESSGEDLVSDILIGKESIGSVYDISFVNAAAWLIRRSVFEQIGGFDPLFWNYGEDNDYINRLIFHGYKVGVIPNAFIYHDREDRQTEWTLERKYISKLIYYKDINNKKTPSLSDVEKTLNKLKLKRLLRKLLLLKNDNYIKKSYVLKRMIEDYTLLSKHRKLCKIRQPNFINA